MNDADRDKAVAELCRVYWPPVYYVVRARGYRMHDAEDHTQGFFAQLLQREQLQRAAMKPNAGRLRSYLLKSLQNYLINDHRSKTAAKRGSGAQHIDFDSVTVERQFARDSSSRPDSSPEELFDRRWASNVVSLCFDRLQSEYQSAGKTEHYQALKSTLGQGPESVPFAEIAEQLDLSVGATRVAAFRLRKQFRTLVREEIRNTVDSEEDFEDEWRHLRSLLEN